MHAWIPRGPRRGVAGTLLALVLLAGLVTARSRLRSDADVPWVATPPDVVQAMLRLAEVGPADTVYDLGSGDGRIVVAAARDFGARAVGVEIDPDLVASARTRARAAGVSGRVDIRRADLFEVDLRDASVVTLYLLPTVNLALRPVLLRDLPPGSRLVSHRWDMGEWRPDAEIRVPLADEGSARVLSWVVPAPAGGTWDVEIVTPPSGSVDGRPGSTGPGPAEGRRWSLRLWQRFQEIEAVLRPTPSTGQAFGGEPGTRELRAAGRIRGRTLDLHLRARPADAGVRLRAVVEGDRLEGSLEVARGDRSVEVAGRRRPWSLGGTWQWRRDGRRVRLSLERRDGVLRARLHPASGAEGASGGTPVPVVHAWGASLYLRLAAPGGGGRAGGETYLGLVEAGRLIGSRRGTDLTVRPWEAIRAGSSPPSTAGRR